MSSTDRQKHASYHAAQRRATAASQRRHAENAPAEPPPDAEAITTSDGTIAGWIQPPPPDDLLMLWAVWDHDRRLISSCAERDHVARMLPRMIADHAARSPQPVDAREIGAALGVDKLKVDMWRQQGLLPDTLSPGVRLWDWRAVEEWARATGRLPGRDQ